MDRFWRIFRHLFMATAFYFVGMCRGLLGSSDPLYVRNNRSAAFARADFVLICGVPFDFRTGYGLTIPFKTKVIAVNRSVSSYEVFAQFMKLFCTCKISSYEHKLIVKLPLIC